MQPAITYLRLVDTVRGVKGTFGIWLDNRIPFGVGLEPSNPIVPAGTYSVSWYLSPKRKKYVFLITPVLGHEGVEIHIGNVVSDTDGCLLIAQGYGKTNAHGPLDDGILYSTATFNLLKTKVGIEKPWILTIKEV